MTLNLNFYLELIQNKNSGLRSLLSESIRMLISNLKYVFPNLNNSGECKTLIFTSSIKGEGKTLASVNTAVSMSADLNTKVILIGADLRNPQIHKNFGLDKDRKGLSEIIYNNDVENYKSYLNKYDNLDFILSGSIPPNPTSMLSGKTFENLILRLKKDYEYIIIDSAPCLLVSDTFQIIKYVDTIIYMFRANFTTITTIEFINELYEQNKITNINVVLNAVGNSAAYGYKYGYQYGYQYGYKYGYNYGYGYGYGSNQNEEKKQD